MTSERGFARTTSWLALVSPHAVAANVSEFGTALGTGSALAVPVKVTTSGPFPASEANVKVAWRGFGNAAFATSGAKHNWSVQEPLVGATGVPCAHVPPTMLYSALPVRRAGSFGSELKLSDASPVLVIVSVWIALNPFCTEPND